MSTTSPTPALPDDHIDLLVTAATAWHVLASHTMAAFTASALEHHLLVATPTVAGRQVRAENTAAIQWAAEQGRSRLVDRAVPGPYSYRPVDHLDPVEVIKAAHAAQRACSPSPTWAGSTAQRLLTGVITAATHRLPGYADAPWHWTRPQHRAGTPVGVTLDPTHPEVPGLHWVTPESLHDHWEDAPLVVITPSAAAHLPASLPARTGVFLLAVEEKPNEVWQAVTALDMPALVLFWPACARWLMAQLANPSPQFVQHRGEP